MSPIEPTPAAPRRDRLHRLLPLVLIVLLPLFPPETRGEGMVGAAFGVVLLVARRSGALSRTWLPLPLLGGALLYFPATLLAAAPGAAVEPLAVWILAAAAGAAAWTLDPDDRRGPGLFAGLAVAGVLVALHALHQAAWGLGALTETLRAEPALPDRAALLSRAEQGRAFAAFPTPAALGGFLALALCVTAGLAAATRGRRRLAWLVAAGIELAGLVATASLTAATALAGAAVAAAARRPEVRRRLWAPALAALLVVGLIAAQRGAEVTEAWSAAHPLRLRAANFRVALEIIADHPWTGVGPGGFGEVYPQYRRAGDNESRHAHDVPLELCAEWGVPAGLAASAIFFWLLLGPLVRAGRDESPWVQGAAVGLAALGLQGLVDFAILLPSLLWSAAILRGWIGRPSAVSRPRTATVSALALAGTAAAATLAILGALGWEARGAARRDVVAGRLIEAERLVRRATRLAPWDPDGWLFRAQIVARPRPDAATDPAWLEEAIDAVERAVALSPVRPAARMTRARLRAATGDVPGAFADAAAAARLYPFQRDHAAARDELARLLAAAAPDSP